MTLSELRYLVAVADLRHFGHAADRCHVTQSTLSTQLRKLEDFLGVTLFERTSRAVTITQIGERIVAHARRMLEEADQICSLARHDEGLLTSTLRLGVIPTVGPYLLPLFLDALHQTYPQLRLVLREDLTANLIEALMAHEVDVLLLALPGEIAGIDRLPLFKERFWVAIPATDPLAKKPVVTERDLTGRKLLLLAEGHCLREQALTVCGEGFRDNASSSDVLRATSLETVCAMVSAGLGCTLLPTLAIPRLAGKGSGIEVRPFVAAEGCRCIGLMWRAAFPHSQDLITLGRFIQERLPEEARPVAETHARAAGPRQKGELDLVSV
jgi:LysR family hydrogen peroxide-inducible transcriptional activator